MHEQRIRSNYRTSKTTYIILLQSSLVCTQMLLSHLQTYFFWAIHCTYDFFARGLLGRKGASLWQHRYTEQATLKLYHTKADTPSARTRADTIINQACDARIDAYFVPQNRWPFCRSARASARHALVNCYVTIYRRASTC